MRLDLLYIGKARDEHSNAIAEEFLKRTGRWATVSMREINPDRYDLFTRHSAAYKVFLDPAGKPWDSARFISFVEESERLARDVVFLLGGHDGLPPLWRPRADLLLALSAMTFPHELARAMLAEQVYRAFATLRGHPYPR
jgi:23S rRNA (pseudouridine1915-N3)-methyltransferase